MRKKTAEMTFPIIVSAIVALVVLVILIAIFSGKANFFNQNTATCSGKGGKCSTDGTCKDGELTMLTDDCSFVTESGEKDGGRFGQCCVPI